MAVGINIQNSSPGTLEAGSQKRRRPRSLSENSPLTHRLKLIDFLSKETLKKYPYHKAGDGSWQS
jgi:hypothetical protein